MAGMALQMQTVCFSSRHVTMNSSSPSPPLKCLLFTRNRPCTVNHPVTTRNRHRSSVVVRASTDSGSLGKGLFPASVPCFSDVIWPSAGLDDGEWAGAFVAMAVLGRLDQMTASMGLSFTIAPLGAVCAVLFATPNSPAAQKYNMFAAQIACAALGVLALTMFGPGWLARATAVAASIAFMIITGATHPPAASLPILFIDGAKFHSLHLWYVFFPGATGCLLLCLIQELVTYLKSRYKF